MNFENTVVHTRTQEEFDLVTKICEEKLNKTWKTIYKLNELYNIRGEKTCINISNFEFLVYASINYYAGKGYNIISTQDFKDCFKADESSNINPKEALGLSNIPMNLFSPIACAYGAIGKLNGSLKYGKANFLGTKVIMSIYMDAIKRHTDAIMAGEENDPYDGVPHFAAILANVDIILCARAAGTLIDDRPLLVGYREEMDKLKPMVKSLQELHKDKTPKHFYLNESE